MKFSPLLVTIAGAIGLATTAIASDLRILPLGDSITRGEIITTTGIVPLRGGYRWHLEDRLQQTGYTFDLIGDRFDAAWNEDGDHEGWGGYQINNIAAVAATSSVVPSADMILVLAGTNDINYFGYADMNALYGDLGTLVSTIRARNPRGKIILSTIPPLTGDGEVAAYNDMLRVFVDDNAYREVTLAEGANVGFNLEDGIHPDQAGEVILGNEFFSSIQRDFWDLYYQNTNNGGGWRTSPSLGNFYDAGNVLQVGTKYFDKMGWLYANSDSRGACWFYHYNMDAWLWTRRGAYPWLWRSTDGAWLYASQAASGGNPGWFFNQSTGAWEDHR